MAPFQHRRWHCSLFVFLSACSPSLFFLPLYLNNSLTSSVSLPLDLFFAVPLLYCPVCAHILCYLSLDCTNITEGQSFIWVCHILPNKMISGSIHFSFKCYKFIIHYSWIKFHCAYAPYFLPSSADGYLSWLYVLTVVNSALINMGVQASLRSVPRSGVAGSAVVLEF